MVKASNTSEWMITVTATPSGNGLLPVDQEYGCTYPITLGGCDSCSNCGSGAGTGQPQVSNDGGGLNVAFNMPSAAGDAKGKVEFRTRSFDKPDHAGLTASVPSTFAVTRDGDKITKVVSPVSALEVSAIDNGFKIEHKHVTRVSNANVVGDTFRTTTITLAGGHLSVNSTLGSSTFGFRQSKTHTEASGEDPAFDTYLIESGPVTGGTLTALRKETLIITPDTEHNTEVHREKVEEKVGATYVLVSDIETTWENFAWGWEKIREAIDPGGVNLVSTWTYYQPGETTGPNASTAGYGCVHTHTRYDGFEEAHTYWSHNHKVQIPFADDADGLTISTTWDTNTRTTIQSAGGTLSQKTETYADNIETTTIYADNGTPPTTLTTTTTLKPYGGDFGGQPASISHPDGTLTTYEYSPEDGGGKTVVMETGTASAGAVVLGKQTTTTYNRNGTAILSLVKTIGHTTDITLDDYAVTDVDNYGRAEETSHFPGTQGAYTTTASYTCCGVESTTDRHGVTTTYAYDGLGRQIKSTTLGVTTETVYDGLSTSTYRYPSTGSADVTNHTNRIARTTRNNLAGTSTTTESPNPGSTVNGALVATTTATTYANGLTTTLTTVPDGTQTTVTHPDGRIASTTGDLQPDMSYSYTVSGVGLVTTSAYIDCNTETTVTTTDWAGRTTNTTKGTESTDYTYNSLGQLESVEDADGVRTLYGYNSRGERIVTALDVNGDGDIDYGIDQITYTETYPNDSFLETSTKVWQEGTTPVETIVSVTRRSPNGLITESWTGDPATAGNQPTITESTVGDTETQSWTETTTRPDGTYVVSSYVGGLLHQTISHDSEDNEIASTTIGYGDYNRPVTSTDLRTGETRTAYVSATCDAVKSVTEENGNNDRTTSYTYDSRSRRTAVTHPDTSETSTSYNPDGTVWEVSGAQTYHVSYTYDYAGRKQTMTTYGTEEATTTWNYYAHTGRLKEKLDNSGQGPLYTYTDAGRLATRTSARGRVTSYGYEGGRLMSVDYFGTNTLWETYLAACNTWLELIAEEASQEAIEDAEAAMNAAYAANAAASDQTTPSLSYTRDTLGRILTVTRGGTDHATYTYDPSTLQLTTEVLNRDSSARTLNRYYDPLGRPLSLKVGTDYTTAYGFDTAGRINRVWDHPDLNATGVPVDGNDVPLEDGDFTYGYQAASYGLVETVTGPAHTVTNTWETTRNVLDTKTNADLSTQPVTISAYNYAVNSIGQRQTVTRSGSKMSADNAIGWNYNSRGELTKEDYNNNTAADPRDRVFQYDDIGNREKTANGTLTLGASNYVADALNQYTKANGIALPIGTDPAYDADGNYQRGPLPAAPNTESILVWDAENRLIQVTKSNGDVISFDYDHLSRRISKTVDPAGESPPVTTRYLYDGWNLIAEYTGTTLTRTYVWGMDLSGSMQGAGGVGGLIAVSEHGMTTGNPPVPTRTPYYPTFDGNGNVSEYLDDAGEAVAHYEYDAFGNTVATLVDDDVDINKDFAHRFSTKSIDIETGLYYYGYRYYDPLTGRWPSRDPIEERGGLNLYGFVRNDGLNRFDRLGFDFGPGITDNETNISVRNSTSFSTPSVPGNITRLLSIARTTVEQSPFGKLSNMEQAIFRLQQAFDNSSTGAYLDPSASNPTYNALTNNITLKDPDNVNSALHEMMHMYNDQVNPGIQGPRTEEGMAYGVAAIYNLVEFGKHFKDGRFQFVRE
jgi:RHS repeat-associated protein